MLIKCNCLCPSVMVTQSCGARSPLFGAVLLSKSESDPRGNVMAKAHGLRKGTWNFATSGGIVALLEGILCVADAAENLEDELIRVILRSLSAASDQWLMSMLS